MMAWFWVFIVTLTILSLATIPTLSISIQSPNRNFSAEARDADQLSQPTPSSFDIILLSDPFIFNTSTSLFSQFMFEIGNGVALVIIPPEFPSKFATNMSFELLHANQFLGIEFYANVCKISSSKVNNNNIISKNSNDLKDGMKLSSWIDYQPTSKQLDVWISKFYDPKPVEPLISHRIDLGEILKGEEFLLGLVSSNEKHEQNTSVYSWYAKIEDSQNQRLWVSFGFNSPGHSVPANLLEHSTSKKIDGLLSILIFAIGCGALAAFVMFFVWSCVVDQEEVKGEASVHHVDCKFEKIDVIEVKKSMK
ncbi:putative legume lectin domain, concanavalin A-like lectin/glucanase domain superfamily [Helianthus anomalus]